MQVPPLSPSIPVASGVAILVLLACSAFFSGSEIAIFSLERHRLNALLERVGADDPSVVALDRLRADPHRLLVTILVGNNLVNIAMTSIATVALVRLFDPGVAVTASTLGMSFVVLVFGEITPKSYGVANPEAVALRVARPLRAIQRVLYPLVAFFDGVSGAINRVTGGGEDIERPYVTREEISALLRTGERVGAIEEREREMVERVFDFSSTVAREVMVPRADVVAVDVTSPLEDVLETCATERVTRLPVYDGTVDTVLGTADIRDVERAIREGRTLRDVLLPTIRVPPGREIDDLLVEMQAERVPMVVVYDEFGELEGVITVEDILEQLVGEIFEVGEERLIRPVENGLVVKGAVTLAEVDAVLDTDLPRGAEFETVAGLINSELGRVGDVGDAVAVGGATLTVEAVDGNRIRRVRVERGSDGGDERGTCTE